MNASKHSKNRPNRGIGRRSGRRWATCLLAGVLALTVIVPAYPAERASAASASTASQGGFTQDQLDGLAYLNEIRAKVGVGPLELDARLTQASQAHAAYYNTTRFEGLTAHREEPGTAGFTGVTAGERGKAAGWPNTSVAEVMSFNNATTREAIDSWLSTAYHRRIILDDQYKSVGIGLQGGTAVMNPAFVKFEKKGPEAKVYPYDGMKGADVGFYGFEKPNPLVRFGVEHSGGIISAAAGFAIDSFEASIMDSKGQEVPYNSELQGDTVFLYPKDVLDGYSVYTVKLNYTLYKETQLHNKTWSFTTGKGRTMQGLSAQYDELVLNPGNKLPIQIVASYDDGTFGTPKTPVAYSSSSPAGLKVSADGTLEGVKPGSYKVTLSSGAVRGTVPVRVFERLKSKSYPATNPTKVKDIAGRSDQAAIEWALRSGIAGADANGKFRPEDSVSEAQFLIMLLRTYKVDDESYASKKKKHWAEGAYKVATARNLLLFSSSPGKSDFRDKPINRYRAAGLIASADGVNFDFLNAVNYVLAHNYMRGTEGNQSWMFGSNDIVTRAQATVILMQLQSSMKQLVGAPKSVTSEKKLPEHLFPEVYIKPALGSKTLIVEFHEDGTLSVEGRFVDQANKQLEIQIDQYKDKVQSGKMLAKIPVQIDSSGRFSISSSGTYTDALLNVYLRTEGTTYAIGVKRGTMNASDYSR
ncbi:MULTISPECIES: CAP domain-containing protein [unclassified Paenibacillus]|uniref:CAP and S-layer homology domain-containing protein n=1 Tax=unclassified Paenibacillus TaxID=185978 RepID=UPI0009A57E80|nr:MULTISPECIES: CAP domain-containing protein [unclassified Paenibacillus]SLK16166.1 S-layer homology domain-containing protein [Paenibacillus sp. RU5A]SOC74230.1 S-layer homology domain-containing protein [Paenibacillus sp. RU26A]SOC76380.1 S-layer homology domain-containing protein [Paenibacillus sp. RU5M]